MAKCERCIQPPVPPVEYYVLTLTDVEAAYLMRRISTSPTSHEPSDGQLAQEIHHALYYAGARK